MRLFYSRLCHAVSTVSFKNGSGWRHTHDSHDNAACVATTVNPDINATADYVKYLASKGRNMSSRDQNSFSNRVYEGKVAGVQSTAAFIVRYDSVRTSWRGTLAKTPSCLLAQQVVFHSMAKLHF